MPKQNKFETIRCQYFEWRLVQRKENGVWYADARTTSRNRGRHSLNTRDKNEAIDNLMQLDRCTAVKEGLIAPDKDSTSGRVLLIKPGRQLFDSHNSRPNVTGGTKASTQKKYRSILDKFEEWTLSNGVRNWNQVTKSTLGEYAKYLTDRGYARKTIHGELTLLKTAVKWLCSEGHLNSKPIKLPLKKAESQRAYCYRQSEVSAMIKLCQDRTDLDWLKNVIIALACTGMRIDELANLKWSDIDFDGKKLTVADESGFANQTDDARSTKSSRSRHIPIQKELLRVLRSVEAVDQYVLHGPRGGKLKPDTVRNILVREVITPLAKHFPKKFANQKSFEDGRLHSFRHYFCSVCANNSVPERVTMEWLGHANSEMVRHYHHLADEESRRHMDQLNLLGEIDGCSAEDDGQNSSER